jgi:DNA-binding beta-propeller fold protein YncE
MARFQLGANVAGSAAACQLRLAARLPGGTNPRFVVIADIGQGNCNVVMDDDGRPIIYYDMGGGTRGNQFTIPLPAPVFCLDVGHSLFILSHWDDDHYAFLDVALAAMQVVGIECLAPAQTSPATLAARRSATSGAVASALAGVLVNGVVQGGDLHVWRDEDAAAPSGNHDATHTDFTVIKVTHSNINNSGLALRLRNPGNPAQYMLLTGDATFDRFRPAGVNRQTFVHGCDTQCVGLVASHHGSDVGQVLDIPRPDPAVTSHLIAYSFGWGNNYGHPLDAGVSSYELRGWKDDHRMDTGGAELAARYAGPRGNIGLVWPGAAPGPGVAAAPGGAQNIDEAAVGLLAATAAEVEMCRPALAGREQVVVGATYQAALECDPAVAAALLAPATGVPTLAPIAAAVGAPHVPHAPHGELTAAMAAAAATAGVVQPAAAQGLVATIVDCVALAAACAAKEVAASVQYEIDEGETITTATRTAYAAAIDAGTLAAMEAAVPDDFLQRALNHAHAHAALPLLPTVAALRTTLVSAVAQAQQARIGSPGVANAQQPSEAAATAAVATAALGRDDMAIAIAAAAGCTPAVPIHAQVVPPATFVDNENAKILQRVAAAAAIAGPAIGGGVTRAHVAAAAAAAARVGLAAAWGAPQVGCHRHPRTCPNGPCSLSVHYCHGMFPARIRTVAGPGGGVHAGDGQPAVASAGFADPRHVLQDTRFAVYVTDTGAHRIRRIGTDGIIQTLAGIAAGGGYGGDANAPAANARFDTLAGVALDQYRNQLYVADSARHRVRRIDLSTGQVSAIAGTTGVAGFNGDDGPALAAQLNDPRGLAYDDADHALYIADTGNHCVRKVDLATGIITTAIGQGTVPGDGPDGIVIGCLLHDPHGLAYADGRLYIADTGNHRIREMSHGQVTGIAGTGVAGTGGTGVPAITAGLNGPRGVGVAGSGPTATVLIADTGNGRIREIDAAGQLITLVGPGGVQRPVAVSSDTARNVYLADDNGHCVREYTRATGALTVFAGTAGTVGDIGDGNLATAGQLSAPLALVCGPDRVFIADTGNRRIRSVTLAGPQNLAAVAGDGNQGDLGDANPPAVGAQLRSPSGLAYDPVAHALYVADTANHCVRRIDLATDSIFLVAGQPGAAPGHNGDDISAIAATLHTPTDLAFNSVTNELLVADSGNNRVRAISLATGVITTKAGTGAGAYGGNGAAATAAQLHTPVSVAADANGNLFIGTSGDHRVRRVDPTTGNITAWAGAGGAGAGGDGGSPVAPAAQLNIPAGLATDNAGNLYISCAGAPAVRMVAGDGSLITTIAGTGAGGYGGDGGDPALAQLSGPRGVHVDEAGRNVFIADAGNHRIRRACL